MALQVLRWKARVSDASLPRRPGELVVDENPLDEDTNRCNEMFQCSVVVFSEEEETLRQKHTLRIRKRRLVDEKRKGADLHDSVDPSSE